MKNKFVKIILIIITFFCIGLFSFNHLDVIKADSGWDSDYDSSWDSGSDWGGSSWDDDYDYNYDDYNDDWDSGSSGSSGTHSKEAAEAVLITIIVAFSFVFFIVIMSSRKSRKFYSSSREQRRREYLSKKIEYNKLTKEQVSKIIPNFDIEEFNFKAYQIFYDIQNAWMQFDYDKLKELITDELYNSYVMDLDVLKTKKQKNTMKGFELINSYIYDLKEENGMYVAKVYLDVKFYDYIEDSNTGKVLRGTQARKLNNTYILTFIRTKDETSNINFCSRCSAPVEGNTTGICEYCKSKLINKTYDWVMSKKEKINQR